ncbi:MAG: hypothetical protein AAF362_20580, partial [Pseudomonadota bacterium]
GQGAVEGSGLVSSSFRESESGGEDGSLVSVGVIFGSDGLEVEHGGAGDGGGGPDVSAQGGGSGVSHDSVHAGPVVAEGDFSGEAAASLEPNSIIVLGGQFIFTGLQEVGSEFRVGQGGADSVLLGVGFGISKVEVRRH